MSLKKLTTPSSGVFPFLKCSLLLTNIQCVRIAVVHVVVDKNLRVLGLCHCHIKVSKASEGYEWSEENNPGALSVQQRLHPTEQVFYLNL